MPRKRSDSRRPATAKANAKEQDNSLVDCLTSGDEEVRRIAVPLVADVPSLLARVWLINELVDRLADDKDAVRRAAAASLVDIGGAAVAVLLTRFRATRDKALRGQVIVALMKIAKSLEDAEGVRLWMELRTAVGKAVKQRSSRRRTGSDVTPA
jgi:hypothetical protein